MKRISEPEVFMQVAELFAKRSTCRRVQVGAVIVKNRRIVSTGYNGVTSGSIHCCDYFSSIDDNEMKIPDEVAEAYGRKEQWAIDEIRILNEPSMDKFREDHRIFSEEHEIHAEQNAISFAARYGIPTEGCSIYVTVSPCLPCAKIIVVSGIEKVIYRKEYDRDKRGIKLLKDSGLRCYKLIDGELVR